jgi:hypothetical protein
MPRISEGEAGSLLISKVFLSPVFVRAASLKIKGLRGQSLRLNGLFV